MATKHEEGDEAKAAPKSKKKLFIIIGVVLVLVLGGGGGFLYMKQKAAAAAAAAEEGGDGAAADHAPAAAAHAAKTPPVYLPMDNMVVNLADPGGERVAQVGITLEVVDAHASDSVKAYMPTIRSSVLMLLSQKTADELLSSEGKQKLIEEILRETSVPFGGGEEEDPAPSKKKKKKAAVQYPVVGVLFSSLIVQ
ncbi:flagellar basal body-associated FliL family protein [Rhodoferax sp.]|uniref:flagellar basal body-associated FliL family protein n=1 Tax=Rhodoferax sp. TaxID=50421 RepID=UPI00260F7690|nr:flagellar basal body-associated FliL family protein [Rhodoferax sp.]MDD4942167.1 flagellar basal body-associated FliL family protein [Rhodoferax sp.]MDD5478255.1 flagellar basal body-associated FliL family protein [Rhodoferax sp.]